VFFLIAELPIRIFAGRLSRSHVQNIALHSTRRESLSSFVWVCADFCFFFRGNSQCYRTEYFPGDIVADTVKSEHFTAHYGRQIRVLLGFMLLFVVFSEEDPSVTE
jgi:hypothetical protein